MLAFTFPGQGSQRPAMGSSWTGHPSWELVGLASEVAGRDVASLLLAADQEDLTKTENAQLATFVLSLVVLDAIERLGIGPTGCAGHSLGEYTALVASGALSLEDGVRLVDARARAMGDAAVARPGTMAAVLGLDDDAVEAACRRAEGEVWVANFNAPSQVVIAGDPADVEHAGAIAKELGARRLVTFPVGGAFHTPFMAPARDALRSALAAASFRAPDPVVVANVDARPHADPSDWPGLLSAQLCSPVRWRQSLSALVDAGARIFVEIGPGTVLTGLAKRVADDAVALSVGAPDDLEALVAAVAGIEAPEPTLDDRAADFRMAERLVVAPSTGPFRVAENFAAAAPALTTSPRAIERLVVRVGDLVGWVGDNEVRSPFAGDLQGIIVLEGERVVTGQPVAWLRTSHDLAGAKES